MSTAVDQTATIPRTRESSRDPGEQHTVTRKNVCSRQNLSPTCDVRCTQARHEKKRSTKTKEKHQREILESRDIRQVPTKRRVEVQSQNRDVLIRDVCTRLARRATMPTIGGQPGCRSSGWAGASGRWTLGGQERCWKCWYHGDPLELMAVRIVVVKPRHPRTVCPVASRRTHHSRSCRQRQCVHGYCRWFSFSSSTTGGNKQDAVLSLLVLASLLALWPRW